jgi:hypothetical protein
LYSFRGRLQRICGNDFLLFVAQPEVHPVMLEDLSRGRAEYPEKK